jgi:putative ABC transport system permease protein
MDHQNVIGCEIETPASSSSPASCTRRVFSLALAIGTGIAFGIVPALDAARSDLNASLREGGRGASGGRGGMRTRRTLVVTQISLAVMLLIGAGLLLRSFAELTRVRLGFDPSHVLTAQLRAAGDVYDSAAAVNRLFDGVLDGIRGTPGILTVGGATLLPTQGRVGTSARVEGEPVDEANLPDLGYVAVRGDYFQAMKIPLKAGRNYTVSDAVGAPKVAILNETGARLLFPHGDAIGHRIRIGPNPNSEPMQIIGIVGDVRDERLDIPTGAMLYANHRQEAWDQTLNIVVRTSGAPETAITALRRSLRAADPSLALRDIQTMEQVVGSSLASRRFALGLIWCFAAIALLLAAVGIHGVLAYTVTSRTREFGVRLALGATTGSVLRLVLRQGITWSLAGLAVGIAGAIAGGRLLAGSLYRVSVIDGATYGAVAAGLLLIVVAACLIPGARATRVDPAASMRAE